MPVRKRQITILGDQIETPMLVPSFSSRGFKDVRDLVIKFSPYLPERSLISAYDMCHHRVLQKHIPGDHFVIIDSGGYEKGGQSDLSEVPTGKYKTKEWKINDYYKTLSNKWNFNKHNTAIVTYDNPKARKKLTFAEQLARAHILKEKFPRAAIDFLIKPGPDLCRDDRKSFFDSDKLASKMSEINGVDIVGVTEKELGTGLLDRAIAISKMRRELKNAGKELPIHVFGSLDPISSTIYFVVGADIFDGLTWMRYGYIDGLAAYLHNVYAILNLGKFSDDKANTRVIFNNIAKLSDLESKFSLFCGNRKYNNFPEIEEMILSILNEVNQLVEQ